MEMRHTWEETHSALHVRTAAHSSVEVVEQKHLSTLLGSQGMGSEGTL